MSEPTPVRRQRETVPNIERSCNFSMSCRPEPLLAHRRPATGKTRHRGAAKRMANACVQVSKHPRRVGRQFLHLQQRESRNRTLSDEPKHWPLVKPHEQIIGGCLQRMLI